MSPSVLAFALVCACIIASFLAIYFWRLSSGYMTILKEGANRYEEIRKHLRNSEENAQHTQRSLKELRDSEKQLASSLRDRNERLSDLERQLETKQKEHQHKITSLELQKNHLLKQVDQLTDRLMLAEQTLASEQEQKMIRKPAEEQTAKVSEKIMDLQRRFQESEKILRQKDSAIVRLEEQLKINGPEKMTQVKRRLAHYERLYASMKSLREMADERNENWEGALQKMASWILLKNESPNSESHLPKSIGPLVGEALEKIGATLVDDSKETPQEERPATLE